MLPKVLNKKELYQLLKGRIHRLSKESTTTKEQLSMCKYNLELVDLSFRIIILTLILSIMNTEFQTEKNKLQNCIDENTEIMSQPEL